PYLLVGWLWFLVTLAPMSGIVQVGDFSMADRFTYLPHIGLFLALVWGAADALRDRLPAQRTAGLTVALLVASAALTVGQVGVWHDSVTLFTHALEATGDNYV